MPVPELRSLVIAAVRAYRSQISSRQDKWPLRSCMVDISKIDRRICHEPGYKRKIASYPSKPELMAGGKYVFVPIERWEVWEELEDIELWEVMQSNLIWSFKRERPSRELYDWHAHAVGNDCFRVVTHSARSEWCVLS